MISATSFLTWLAPKLTQPPFDQRALTWNLFLPRWSTNAAWKRVTTRSHEAEMNVDFCQLFTRERKSLYSLSLLLTASPEKAERCFISSLEDCLKGSAVAEEWAHSWAKRVVIKNAIRLIGSYVHCAERKPFSVSGEIDEDLSNLHVGNPIVRGVLTLGDFERLVFVMTVLERYSDRDSAILLGRRQQEIRAGRIRALQELAAPHYECAPTALWLGRGEGVSK